MLGDKPDEGGGFSYWTNGDGKWFRSQRAWRCTNNVLWDQCQGVSGHEGVCWQYDKAGHFCWADKLTGYSGSTPPDHKAYKTPLEMSPFGYGMHRSEPFEITDPDELARLERGETEVGESTMRPIMDKATIRRLRWAKWWVNVDEWYYWLTRPFRRWG